MRFCVQRRVVFGAMDVLAALAVRGQQAVLAQIKPPKSEVSDLTRRAFRAKNCGPQGFNGDPFGFKRWWHDLGRLLV